MKGVSRIFKLRALNADDFQMWTFKLMKTIENSKGHLLGLGIDEKHFSVKSWRFD